MQLTPSDRTFMKHFALMIVMLAGTAVVLIIIGAFVWASLPKYDNSHQVKRAGNRIAPVAAVYSGKAGHAAVTAAKAAASPSGPKSSGAAPSGPYKFVAAKGKKLYAAHCAACHQASGMGLPNTFPPLKDNPAVTNADPTVHIETILHGKHGVAIDGKKYSGVMPPFASQLTDREIATIANHERTSWGNHAKQVTPSEVAKIRAKGK